MRSTRRTEQMTKIAKNKYPVIRSTTRKMATIEHALEITVS